MQCGASVAGGARAAHKGWHKSISFVFGKVRVMENEKAVIGALFFILLVVGANFIMYGIARGAAQSKGKGLLGNAWQSHEHVH